MSRKLKTSSAYFPNSSEQDSETPEDDFLSGNNGGFEAMKYSNNSTGYHEPSRPHTSVVHGTQSETMFVTKQITFPHHRAVLWDREVIGSPVYLKSDDVVPSLLLTNPDIVNILRKLSTKTQSTVLFDCVVKPTVAVKRATSTNKSGSGSGSVGDLAFYHGRLLKNVKEKYVFEIQEHSYSTTNNGGECVITLPMTCSPNKNGDSDGSDSAYLFDPQSTG